MMNFEEIRNYWEGRAAGDSSVQSTTQDVFLREIELNTLSDRIRAFSPRRVADVGSGDGRTTIGLARKFSNIQFFGFDYSPSMVDNSREVLASEGIQNAAFEQRDICNGLSDSYDLIYTTRCLINLPAWDIQKDAIRNIHGALTPGGNYLMIENFLEGQENFNRVRRSFDLPEIPIREHNYYFQRQRLLDYATAIFDVTEETNISSAYYLVSRIVYSKICQESGTHPDYFDAHHRYAAGLPFCGEFGPVRLIAFRKR
jgi:SAM-dependent methyltransferase